MSHADNRALGCADDSTSATASKSRGATPPSPRNPVPARVPAVGLSSSGSRPWPRRGPKVGRPRKPRRNPSAGAAVAASAAGVSTAPARQLPGWRHGPAPPRPCPSLAPAPTCVEFVYLAAMATRGGAAGRRGEERQGAGPGGGAPRATGRRRGATEREVISKKRAAAAGSSPAERASAAPGARGAEAVAGGGGTRSRRVPLPAPLAPHPATRP